MSVYCVGVCLHVCGYLEGRNRVLDSLVLDLQQAAVTYQLRVLETEVQSNARVESILNP